MTEFCDFKWLQWSDNLTSCLALWVWNHTCDFNRTLPAYLSDFKITHMNSDRIALHSAQLPLFLYFRKTDSIHHQAMFKMLSTLWHSQEKHQCDHFNVHQHQSKGFIRSLDGQMDYFQILSTFMQGNIKAPSPFVIMLDYEERPINYRGGAVTAHFASVRWD